MMIKKKLNVGFVGLGERGTGLLKDSFLPLGTEGLIVKGVCDVYEDRTKKAADIVEEQTGERPFETSSYSELLSLDIDAVIIASSWETHIPFAIEAMKKGVYPGVEVGGAYSVKECWKLVETYEKTGVPCMLLENCCYGKRELTALEMVRQGIFGEIVYCAGGYKHDLRKEVANGEENRHYRLRNYIHRNAENYPTHELGPIAKILGINNGNRLLTLTSSASSAKGVHAYIIDRKGADDKYANTEFRQADIVNTSIKCANGELINLTLDTTLPRSYSRGFEIRGTKGGCFEDNDSVFIDHEHDEYEIDGRPLWGNSKEYFEKYKHRIWRENKLRGIDEGPHAGIDEFVAQAFVYSAKRNEQPPVDVYDMATWMCITALSEQSIATGGMPVAIPDFTRGRWINRDDIVDGPFSLNIHNK